jgi:hypothetical protein
VFLAFAILPLTEYTKIVKSELIIKNNFFGKKKIDINVITTISFVLTTDPNPTPVLRIDTKCGERIEIQEPIEDIDRFLSRLHEINDNIIVNGNRSSNNLLRFLSFLISLILFTLGFYRILINVC